MKRLDQRYPTLIFLLTVALLLCGCVSREKKIILPPEQRFTFESDTLQSDTAVRDNDALYTAFEDAFLSEYVLINDYTLHIGYTDAEDFIITHMRYVQKAQKIKELTSAALRAVYEKAESIYAGKSIQRFESIEYPSWQYLASTLPFAGSESYLLYDIMQLKITTAEESGSVRVSVDAHPAEIRQFAKDRADEQREKAVAANTYVSIRYTYAYLTALYDADGSCIIPEETPAPTNGTPAPEPSPTPAPTYYDFGEEYMAGLVYPLDNKPDFRDTWTQGRSDNTRRHMGTDIVSREGYNVYSICAGEVIYKGTDKIPGNYVIVLDDYGFEYHYYHLVELPPEVNVGDRVAAGEIIAHVGNTGNSDASHLHVSIISPDGVFLNPYKLLKTLENEAGE